MAHEIYGVLEKVGFAAKHFRDAADDLAFAEWMNAFNHERAEDEAVRKESKDAVLRAREDYNAALDSLQGLISEAKAEGRDVGKQK